MFRPFRYAGRMALTNYITQTLVGVGIFTGLGLFGIINLRLAVLICLIVYPLQMVFSYYLVATFSLWTIGMHLAITDLSDASTVATG